MVVGPGLMPVSWLPCLQHTQLPSNRNIVLFPLRLKQGGLKKSLCAESEAWRKHLVKLGSSKKWDIGFKTISSLFWCFADRASQCIYLSNLPT